MTGRIILLFVMAAAGFASAQTSQHPQNVIPVTDGWKFVRADVNGAEAVAFDDSKWSQVTLPHTWPAASRRGLAIGPADGGNDKDTIGGKNYYRGPGWYRIKLAIPETAKDKRVFIHFEAASLVADVYFNGVRLGQHRGGFTAFCYELTPHIQQDGPNVLAVRVDNSFFEDVPPLGGDFNISGGLYRPVWLIIKNPGLHNASRLRLAGIYIKQTTVTKEEAIIDVTAKVSNGLDKTVSANLLAAGSNIDGSFNIKRIVERNRTEIGAGQTITLHDQVRIKNPHLWNGRKDPFMYNVSRVNLHIDAKMGDSLTIRLVFVITVLMRTRVSFSTANRIRSTASIAIRIDPAKAGQLVTQTRMKTRI